MITRPVPHAQISELTRGQLLAIISEVPAHLRPIARTKPELCAAVCRAIMLDANRYRLETLIQAAHKNRGAEAPDKDIFRTRGRLPGSAFSRQ
jgi:hypothetical protein